MIAMCFTIRGKSVTHSDCCVILFRAALWQLSQILSFFMSDYIIYIIVTGTTPVGCKLWPVATSSPILPGKGEHHTWRIAIYIDSEHR